MQRPRWWVLLLGGVSALVALLSLAAVGALLLGQVLPQDFSIAYEGRFERRPHALWADLRLPAEPTEIRKNAQGQPRPVSRRDRSGPLVFLAVPDTFLVRVGTYSNVTIAIVETYTADGNGSIVRVETVAEMRGPIHRVLFPPMLRSHARDRLMEIARIQQMLQPQITRTTPVHRSVDELVEARLPDQDLPLLP